MLVVGCDVGVVLMSVLLCVGELGLIGCYVCGLVCCDICMYDLVCLCCGV